MFSNPFFRYPYYNYAHYKYYHGYPFSYMNPNYAKQQKSSSENESSSVSSSHEDRDCFEIMGIKLYFDDILLICIIFFLYSEGVQDDMLFMALILLLLS